MDVSVCELVGLLVIEEEAILVNELRDGDSPEGRGQVLQNVFVQPLLN